MFDPPAVITTTQAYAIQLTAYVLHIPYDSGPPSASLGLTPPKRETHLIAVDKGTTFRGDSKFRSISERSGH